MLPDGILGLWFAIMGFAIMGFAIVRCGLPFGDMVGSTAASNNGKCRIQIKFCRQNCRMIGGRDCKQGTRVVMNAKAVTPSEQVQMETKPEKMYPNHARQNQN